MRLSTLGMLLAAGAVVSFPACNCGNPPTVSPTGEEDGGGGTSAGEPDAGPLDEGDAGLPALSIGDLAIAEGNVGATMATFTVVLSRAATSRVTVLFDTADESATAPGDYEPVAGTLTFAPGETTQTISVQINGDPLHEPDETFLMRLSSATGAELLDGSATGTITNDDAAPALSIADTSASEASPAMLLAVTMSAASAQPVTVAYSTAPGTAAAGTDYVTTSGSFTIAPGDTTATIAVPLLQDGLDEADETFTVTLTSTEATIARGEATATILDDDEAPALSVDDLTFLEGDTGSTSQRFTVTLSEPSGQTVTVAYATADGTALAGSDYTATSGTLTFLPGDLSKAVTLAIAGDLVNEGNETFTLTLSAPTNATLTKAVGTATITNDDSGLPTLSVTDVSVTEGNFGTVPATFTVTLSAASASTVSVAYATANGTALSPGDYQAANGTLSFAPGVTTQQVTVLVNGDFVSEAAETFLLDLSAPVNAVIADAQGVGTILDDDSTPSLTINDVSVLEGAAGTVTAVFTLSLSGPSGLTVTVNAATANGTATTATGVGGSDYVATSATVTFAPGTTTRTFAVTVNGDTLNEPDETFLVNLTQPFNATLADNQGQGTILNDDALPALSITDEQALEGNAGQTAFTFTVSLSSQSGQPVTVSYATSNGTAAAGSDYTGANGTLTFAPGQTQRAVTVQVTGDTTDEPNETFDLDLSNASNATIADARGVGTILNDDSSLPGLNVSDASASESASTITHTVTLSAASTQTVTVQYQTSNGTATAGADYTAASGTLTFLPGQTQQTITVSLLADALDEDNETYLVTLANATNATIVDGQGTGTITDDDPSPSLAITDVRVTEGDSGTVDATFVVTLSAVSGRTVSVNYATADGTALAGGGVGGSDYVSASATLTFPAGTTTQSITIKVNGDLLNEADETFRVNLSGAVNATISDNQGIGTIANDDPLPSLSISDVSDTEGNAGQFGQTNTKAFTFTVSLSAASGRSVTVNYATANGTAQAGFTGDYLATNGTLTFNAGDTSKTVTVTVNGDNTVEQNETFFVNLSAPGNATIADSQGQGLIINDD